MPETEREVLDAIIAWTLPGRHIGPVFAILERVSASPQMGVTSAFSFGKGYGGLLMALTALQIPFELVSPVRWQNALGCRTKGDKNITKRRAQQIFPNIQITHAIADALLLAEYGRRTFGGTHGKEKDSGEEQAPIQREEGISIDPITRSLFRTAQEQETTRAAFARNGRGKA